MFSKIKQLELRRNQYFCYMDTFSRFKTNYSVRPDDIDLFQHVHNSRYLDYVLAARYDQMRECYGMTMEEFMSKGYGWVVKSVAIDYLRPMKMGDQFSVETGIVSMHDRGCRVSFEISMHKNNKTAAKGWFDYVLIDLKTGRSSVVTEEMLQRYSI